MAEAICRNMSVKLRSAVLFLLKIYCAESAILQNVTTLQRYNIFLY